MCLLRGQPCAFNFTDITYFFSNLLSLSTDSIQAEFSGFSNLNIFKSFYSLVMPWRGPEGEHETDRAALAQHAPYHISSRHLGMSLGTRQEQTDVPRVCHP